MFKNTVFHMQFINGIGRDIYFEVTFIFLKSHKIRWLKTQRLTKIEIILLLTGRFQ